MNKVLAAESLSASHSCNEAHVACRVEDFRDLVSDEIDFVCGARITGGDLPTLASAVAFAAVAVPHG
jgi:hypothetical protein